jgi:hypothetical protein
VVVEEVVEGGGIGGGGLESTRKFSVGPTVGQ